MTIFLEIQSGPQSGFKLKATPGIKIGRSEGDLRLPDDAKVSGLHANIDIDNKGQYILFDLDSGNGLTIEGRRVKKIALLPGVRFRIGDTLFAVTSENEAFAPILFQQDSWKSKLKAFVLRKHLVDVPPGKGVQVFSPSLHLRFLSGIQADQELLLTYGPRSFGSNSLDLSLTEENLPDFCFIVSPAPEGAALTDLTGGLVRLNGAESRELTTLKDGDVISIGNTQIQAYYE